jgi:hypothetical protein
MESSSGKYRWKLTMPQRKPARRTFAIVAVLVAFGGGLALGTFVVENTVMNDCATHGTFRIGQTAYLCEKLSTITIPMEK